MRLAVIQKEMLPFGNSNKQHKEMCVSMHTHKSPYCSWLVSTTTTMMMGFSVSIELVCDLQRGHAVAHTYT